MPGLVWLVRNGASEVGSLSDVASGASAPLRAEDMRIQESGSAQYFATAPSGRAAIGIDSAGQLTLATVDGRTDWLGLDLATFATWLVRAGGLVQAINLDGGASVTLLHDGRAANVPSYSCMEPGARGSWGRPAARGASGQARGADDPDFKCSRPVSSGVCIHDDPLAPVTSSAGRLSLAAGGCVCFDADGGDDSFTLDEVRGMVDLDGRGRRLREAAWDAALAEEDTSQPPAARRLAGGSASPADAIILPLPEPLFMPRTRDALLAQVATLAAAAGRPVALRGLDPVCLCTSDATVGHAGGGGGDGHTVSARAHFMLHRLSLSERRARWLAALRELRLPASAQLPEWPPYAGEVDTEESRRDGAGLGAAPRASAAASSGGYRAWAALALVGALCAGVGAGGCRGRGRRAGKAATY